ncbi:FtsQ-type POTRA domain-containing protein [Salinibacterium sp. M195]|uniref:FtsQ-type POTRA domain-containing protein n=1 Tax=Salinibacterium sp. M195 TaxID=2583374 RepID=UPI002105EA17|nr:FtsQ-type POTRA domain-containing protein [Salinibacterium sp. M195]
MKRPEGFDKPVVEPPARRTSRRRNDETDAAPQSKRPVRPSTANAPAAQAKSGKDTVGRSPADRAATNPRQERSSRSPLRGRGPSPDALAKKQLRQAGRARKRAERAELRRFTRRARNRKFVLLSVAGLVVTLLALIAVAVFSPILALRTVVVDGTNRIDPAEIQAAVATQEGTPLALLDFDAITRELSVFPLIRSYVTEIVPPDTLLVHIVEREPIGSVKIAGVFRLVDPAGITIQESAERIEGVPVIDVGGADMSSPAFAAVTEVLLSLPAELRSQVTSASATTKDDVSFVLAGVGQRVVWGSASDSAKKAVLLATLVSITDPGRAGEFDVSAPSNGIFREN